MICFGFSFCFKEIQRLDTFNMSIDSINFAMVALFDSVRPPPKLE